MYISPISSNQAVADGMNPVTLGPGAPSQSLLDSSLLASAQAEQASESASILGLSGQAGMLPTIPQIPMPNQGTDATGHSTGSQDGDAGQIAGSDDD